MNSESKVVLTTSIVLDIEPSEDGDSARLNDIKHRLQSALVTAFWSDNGVEVTKKISFDWLNEPGANFGRCVSCHRLVSDCEKPNQIIGLFDGTVVDGVLMCDECRCFGRGETSRHGSE